MRDYIETKLRQLGDTETQIFEAELFLMRRVVEASSDLVQGRNWPEFRDSVGGQDVLVKQHEDAVARYERWMSENEGD